MTGDLPYRGSVEINGTELSALSAPALAANACRAGSEHPCRVRFTVLEVVRLGVRGTGWGAIDDIALAALARCRSRGPCAARRPRTVGGRAATGPPCACACAGPGARRARGPRWLFLDEPVASLDIAHQLQVMRLARRFADAGGGVVAIMHDLNLTAMFADRLALMANGRVALTGAPDAVMTDDCLQSIYGCALRVGYIPPACPRPAAIGTGWMNAPAGSWRMGRRTAPGVQLCDFGATETVGCLVQPPINRRK